MANEWDVGTLLSVSSGYWRGCAVQAAVRLKVFTILGAGPCDAAGVAELAGSDVRATGLLLDALTAMGLLVKKNERFANTEASRSLLAKDSPDYIGHIIGNRQQL